MKLNTVQTFKLTRYVKLAGRFLAGVRLGKEIEDVVIGIAPFLEEIARAQQVGDFPESLWGKIAPFLGENEIPSVGELTLTSEVISPRWPYFKTPEEYEKIYDTKQRQIRRWHDTGKKENRHCPLDEPHRMAAWWRVCMKQRVPDCLLVLEKTTPLPPTSMGNPIDPDLPSQPNAPKEEGANPAVFASVDLSALEFGEGQQVKQARALCQANYNQLEAAYKNGDSDAVRRWLPLWKSANDNLRLVEKEDREARKAAGELISRNEVFTELSQLLEALRQMRSSMAQKILSDLESHATGRRRRILRLLAPEILESVANSRDREEHLFRNLESCQSSEQITLELAA